MSTKPLFSVVIPSYNCSKFLERSLTSVFDQSFQDVEIIVVDNSSTDDTEKILERFATQKLSSVSVQNHGVIAYSRNVGIKQSQGEWIAFLDADDVWLPRKLEIVCEAIANNPEAILFCHDEWKVVNNVRKSRNHYGPRLADCYESLVFCGGCLSTSATVLRRDIALSSGGFSERRDFITVEDHDYWTRLSRLGSFHFIEEVLGEWHIHSENASGSSEVHARAVIAVGEYHLAEWLKEHPESERRVKMRSGMLLSGASRIFLRNRDFRRARAYALQAIPKDPLNWKTWVSLFLATARIGI